MTGPEFLSLYWSALGALVVIGIALAVWVRTAPAKQPTHLDPYGIALLSGGWKRVGDTALAGLAARGQVRVSRSSGYTPIATARPADPYEDVVLRELHGARRSTFPGMASSPAALDLQRRMAEAGLLRRPDRARRAKKIGWLFFLLVVVGIVRVVQGIGNERPVGFLVLSIIAAVVAWVVIVPSIAVVAGAPKATRQGQEALAEARRADARSNYHPHNAGLGVGMAVGAAVLLPVAFAGLGAYPDPEMSDAFRENEAAAAAASSSGSSGGDSGSSGGDGGGSSCGGGGGCGGCGGCG